MSANWLLPVCEKTRHCSSVYSCCFKLTIAPFSPNAPDEGLRRQRGGNGLNLVGSEIPTFVVNHEQNGMGQWILVLNIKQEMKKEREKEK